MSRKVSIQMINPFAEAMQRSIEAMLVTLQEEIGKVFLQLIKEQISPDMLAQMMQAMQGRMSAFGFDMGQFASAIGQQPSFDPYKVLGLERSATDEEVKKRYHELLHVLHPDKSGTPGTSLFLQMVLAAFEAIKRGRVWQ